MSLTFSKADSKAETFNKVQQYLDSLGLKVVAKDFERPWGGFFVIDETQAQEFAKNFFPGINVSDLKISGKLSPKILMVQPERRLSWQYHHRRAEIWKLVAGEAGIVRSDTDEEGAVEKLTIGEIIRLRQGQRHRLIGLAGWGMISEIWQHTDASRPSDEDDIVRVQDDFGR
ncbi:cupin domain-containing protein [Pseudochryseolinea flava]|uniref:Phosphoheptose isomerase n=1 Tax=Pseudochryseolinea flava TaxID=2059302 RepID=A0A364XY35_9BACT|nr:phosphoheptose isomerase [Pseudochryseolinea flava]RAV98331.1 phosphoheptose isomerase [Pseudochryseolinea flava]